MPEVYHYLPAWQALVRLNTTPNHSQDGHQRLADKGHWSGDGSIPPKGRLIMVAEASSPQAQPLPILPLPVLGSQWIWRFDDERPAGLASVAYIHEESEVWLFMSTLYHANILVEAPGSASSMLSNRLVRFFATPSLPGLPITLDGRRLSLLATSFSSLERSSRQQLRTQRCLCLADSSLAVSPLSSPQLRFWSQNVPSQLIERSRLLSTIRAGTLGVSSLLGRHMGLATTATLGHGVSPLSARQSFLLLPLPDSYWLLRYVETFPNMGRSSQGDQRSTRRPS